MDTPDAEQTRLRHIEWALFISLVLLKLHVLQYRWGAMEGFDGAAWVEVFRLTEWFEQLPSPRAMFASYHPPLSYLLTRLVFAVYPHEVEASQVVSSVAILGGFWALRRTLLHTGGLWTVPGLWFLYGTVSVPLIVWVAVETGYDAVVFGLFMAALALAARLFWHPRPVAFWKDCGAMVRVTLLGLCLAAGLLNKFTGLLAFALPFLIIVVRRGWRAMVKESGPAVVAALIGAVVAGPLYYQRYYATEHRLMPASMEWQRPEVLKPVRAVRDAAPVAFLGKMLRFTSEPILGAQNPAMQSFPHSVWLHTWKRDLCLGKQPPGSLAVSDAYICVFPVLLLIGTALFFLRRRHIPVHWRHLGWITLAIAVMFCASALMFAWKYPVWDWRVFKGKYVSPAMLWLGYASGLALTGTWFRSGGSAWRRRATDAALVILMAFMFLNHVIPVY